LKSAFVQVLVLIMLPAFLTACGRSEPPRFIMATSFTMISPETQTPAQNRLIETQAANIARDEVLSQALQMRFPNGISLGDAALQDPFIRAKVYDTVRGARITDKTLTDGTHLSVTVRLELEPIYKILETYPAPEPTT
jgi:hypothetical protein